jgi:hypothetical protein
VGAGLRREGVYLLQSLAPGWRLWVALSSKADQVKSLRAKTALNICPLLDLARNNTSSTEAMTQFEYKIRLV